MPPSGRFLIVGTAAQEVKRAYLAGESRRVISRRLGVSEPTVRDVLVRLGVELRARTKPAPYKHRRARPRRSLEERFWEKVNKDGPIPDGRPDLGPCWLWTGARVGRGYGKIGSGGHSGKTLMAHRVSWQIHFGEIPDELAVCHECDNPPCVNPGHFVLGTIAYNNRDMIAKGRRGRVGARPGEQNHRTHLTRDDVRTIRQERASGVMLKLLAARYGVTVSCIHQIAKGNVWRDA